MELRRSVIKGMVWSAAEKAGVILFQSVAALVLANFLYEEDLAVMAILTAFVVIFSVFVDSGFSAAIIREKDVKDYDYSAVFFFNIAVSIFLYVVLVAAAPFVGRFYGYPELGAIAPVLFLIFPVNALSIIQSAILVRRLDFKTLSKYTLSANLMAGAVAIGLAASGFGVWALVGQRLTTPVFRALLLWIKSDWRPRMRFVSGPIRSMFPYSSRLLLSDLANAVYANISKFFIGKMYDGQLGHYEQAYKQKDTIVSSAENTIRGVTFPALSRLQDDPVKMPLSARQVVVVANMLMFPAMVGLIAVAGDIFAAFVPDRWLPAVPLLQVFCVSGLFVPLSVVSYNIMKIKSDGKMILRLEVVKKSIATVILITTIPLGVKAIVWGQVGIFATDALVNMFGADRFVEWKPGRRIVDTLPYAAFSLVMWGAVYSLGLALEGVIAVYWVLAAKIISGASVYFMLLWIFKPAGWSEAVSIIRDHFAKRGK